MTHSLENPSYAHGDSFAARTSDAVVPGRPLLISSGARSAEFGQANGAWPGGSSGAPPLVGASPAIASVTSDVELVASRTCNVLIEGETGTGKEVVARAIHALGSRSKGPWVAVNCGAIPEALLEAELFGHIRGAFTGAIQSRAGKFEIANRGTIFLDEITEMPMGLQAKLLRGLQERELERLGGNEKIRLDIRVVAATNAGLSERVRQGLFREDLYYRLNVFRIWVPPLRDRRDDIPLLARHFIEKICRAEGCRIKNLEGAAMDRLMCHTWSGNVRELENIIETSIILSSSRVNIAAGDIRFYSSPSEPLRRVQMTASSGMPEDGLDFQKAVEEFEQSLLTHALTRVRGNKTAAAELLGLKRTTLAAKMRALGTRMPRLVA